MRRLAIVLASLAAMPALGAPPAPPPPNAFNDRMLRLSPADQKGALRRAVTLEDMRCGRVAKSAYRGRFGNLGFWQAQCTPGGDYAVFLGPDESAQVRACGDMRGLKLPQCTPMK